MASGPKKRKRENSDKIVKMGTVDGGVLARGVEQKEKVTLGRDKY
jgi:hypothetical protein